MSAKRNHLDTQRLMVRLRHAEYRRLRERELAFLDMSGALEMTRRRLSMLLSGRGSRRRDRVLPDDIERCRTAVDAMQSSLVVIRKDIARHEQFISLLERCEGLFETRHRPARLSGLRLRVISADATTKDSQSG